MRVELSSYYFAIQTFFGSVKKPTFAKATARQAPRFSSVNLSSDTNILSLCEKVERLGAAFAADAAGFHPTEGNAQVAHEPAVYPDCPYGFVRRRDGRGLGFGSDARGEAVIGVVGVADHFLFAIERSDGNDRAEDFFAIGAARDWQTSDDGWRKEVTGLAAFVN